MVANDNLHIFSLCAHRSALPTSNRTYRATSVGGICNWLAFVQITSCIFARHLLLLLTMAGPAGDAFAAVAAAFSVVTVAVLPISWHHCYYCSPNMRLLVSWKLVPASPVYSPSVLVFARNFDI